MKSSVKRIMILSLLATFIGGAWGCNKTKTSEPTNTSINNTGGKQTVPKVEPSGLLLGFVKSSGAETNTSVKDRVASSYRTLWIYTDNNKDFKYEEKRDGIITPYSNEFWKLKNSKFTQSAKASGGAGQSGNIYFDYEYYYNVSNILSNKLSEPAKELFDEHSFKKVYGGSEGLLDMGFFADFQALDYVGNRYAIVKGNYLATGGGTYRSNNDYVKMYDINNLSGVDGISRNVKLADLISASDKDKVNKLYLENKKPAETNGLITTEQKPDIDDLTLKRVNGQWRIQLPLYNFYEHSGNGSNGKTLVKYIDTDISVPDYLKVYDTLCVSWDTIKQKFPDARDAVSSPKGDIMAVLTSKELLIFYNPKAGFDKPSLTIQVGKDENIILNQWATGEYVSKWSSALAGN